MLRFLFTVAVVFLATGLPTAISAAEPVLEKPITWAEEFRPIYPSRASYPRVAQLADGMLLATFAHSTPESREIGCVSSKDSGRTWGNYRKILDQNRPVDLDNAFPLQLPDGSILAAYRRHTPGTYRIEVQASIDDVDGGKHWALRGTIATGHDGLWEPFLLLLPSGVIQAYYASEEGCKPDQRIEMRSSSDGGKTWGSPVTVAQKKGSRDGMPGVVRLDKDELLAVFEAQDDPPYRFVIRGVRSSDNGRTWATTRELVYRPSNPVVNRWTAGAPSIIRLPDKRLLVSFQSDEQVSYLQGDRRRDPAVPGYDYVRHSHFACVTSSDNGRTWTRPQHLLGSPEQPACWNTLYALKDGAILALSNYQGRIWSKTGSLTTFDIKTKKPTDQVKVKFDGNSATLDVFSPSGIGGATITLPPTQGPWPKTFVLRLHLRGLESFTASNGKIKLTGSVLSHSGNTKRLHLGEDGKGERGERG